jgi:hypothetical protein
VLLFFSVLIFLLHFVVVLVFLVVSAGWLVIILSSHCDVALVSLSTRTGCVCCWLLATCDALLVLFLLLHRIHKEGDLQIPFFVIFRESTPLARAHVTSGTLIYCDLSLAVRRTQTPAEFG